MNIKLFEENFFSKSLPKAISKQRKNFFNLAVNYGQFNTMEAWSCEDKRGNPIPWYTYPAIEYLNNLDFSSFSIFEFGSGNSSKYWAERASKVLSIEHNTDWYNKTQNHKMSNLAVTLEENESLYASYINKVSLEFDVIVIDGVNRFECAVNVIEKVKQQPIMIILDNSDWYPKTAKLLRDSLDLIQVDFHGFGPINDYTWTTSVLFSRDWQNKPIDDIQPHYSRCGLRVETSE